MNCHAYSEQKYIVYKINYLIGIHYSGSMLNFDPEKLPFCFGCENLFSNVPIAQINHTSF